MSGTGWEVLSDVREWLGGPTEYTAVVGRPFRMSGNGREALPEFRDWLGGPFRMSESGPEILTNVQDALLDVREWSADPWGFAGFVRRPSRMTGSGQEALPKCPGVIRRPSRMSGSGQEALPNVREWSEGNPGCLGVAGRPSRMSGSGQEALQDLRVVEMPSQMSRSGQEILPDVRDWLGGPL